MIQMFSKLHISVASSCDVEIALDFISVQAAKDTATVRLSTHPRCLAELPLPRLA